jgi:hypothetical protein
MCSCDDFMDGDWWWEAPSEHPLATKRHRKCCSCGGRIAVGDRAVEFPRYRLPRNDVEARIHYDQVPLASWWMCEACGDLFWSLSELGFCIVLPESMPDLVKEYAEAYGPQAVEK